MKNGLFIIILAVFFFLWPSTPAVAKIGCWKAIQGRAVSEQMAKLLPRECQSFRKTYLADLRLLSKDSKKLSLELSKKIQAQKSFLPPYDDLLISVLISSHSAELKKAIADRAQIEQKLKMKYRYAVATQERIEKGSCSDQFSDVAYYEICKAKDVVYARVEKLSQDRE